MSPRTCKGPLQGGRVGGTNAHPVHSSGQTKQGMVQESKLDALGPRFPKQGLGLVRAFISSERLGIWSFDGEKESRALKCWPLNQNFKVITRANSPKAKWNVSAG